MLSAALDEHQAASGGVLPVEDQTWLATLVEYLWQQGHFARARGCCSINSSGRPTSSRAIGSRSSLYELYRIALDAAARCRWAAGRCFTGRWRRSSSPRLDTPDENHRYSMVSRLCDFYRSARSKRIPGVADDVRAFAFQRLPELLKRQRNNYQSLVSAVAGALHEVAGPRDGLALPHGAGRRASPNGSATTTRTPGTSTPPDGAIGAGRREPGPDLEERLLRIVLAELRQDLQTRQSRNRAIYQRHYNYFWTEKADVFAQTAEEVLAKNRQSGTAVVYIAEYFYNGLDRYGRAIEILQDAHRREMLDEGGPVAAGRITSRWQDRYAESIAAAGAAGPAPAGQRSSIAFA